MNRSEELLEREAEVARLEGDLDAAQAGAGRATLLHASAGLGKSRLVETAARLAESRGVRVLPTTGDELESGLPWGVVRGLLEPALDGLDPAARRRLLSGAASPARALFVGGAAGLDPPGDERALAVTHALLRVVAGLAGERPLLLIVDDAHWADPLSVGFLRYLSRRLPALPVALLVTVRAGDPGAIAALDALADVPALTRIDPAPLTGSAVATMVRAELDGGGPETAERCAQLTGGNPLYLRQLLADVRTHGTGHLDAVDDVGSEPVARSVLARLRAHGRRETSLARAVAILGAAVAGTAAALAALDLTEALSAADALDAADILTSGATLAFVHPLVRHAVHADIPAGQRAEAHGRAAALLARAGAPVEVVAEHLVASPIAGDPAVVGTLREAATRALRAGAPAQAVHLLRRAVEEPVDAGLRAEVLIELAQAEALSGLPEAPARLRQALEHVAPGAPRAELLLALGWALHLAGRPGDAAAAFSQGRAEVAPDDALGAELEAGYLTACLLDAERAPEAHARVSTLLVAGDSPATPGQLALVSHAAVSSLFAGRPVAETLALVRRLEERIDPERDVTGENIALWNMIGTLSWCDVGPEAIDYATRALGAAEAQGSVSGRAMALYARSWPLLYAGRIEASVHDAQGAVEIWAAGAQNYLPAAVYWLVWGLLELGDPAGARDALEALESEAAAWEDTAFHGLTLAARGRVAQAEGDPEAALTWWLACGRHMRERMQAHNPSLVPWASEAALAAHAVGDDRAAALAAGELARAERFGAARPLGVALRTVALVGPPEERAAGLAQAAEALERSPSTLARLRVELARARLDDAPDARQRLREVVRSARRLGALAIATEGEAALRSAGGRMRESAGARGAEGLTASERRVARLAADGLSNQEIALALFVTVKAVEWHLSNAYRKLGIRRRGQLAAALSG